MRNTDRSDQKYAPGMTPRIPGSYRTLAKSTKSRKCSVNLNVYYVNELNIEQEQSEKVKGARVKKLRRTGFLNVLCVSSAQPDAPLNRHF